MLSYQHHYHAGNHADVIKHWVLLECIHYLQKKNKPFDYIDTHAGAGLYRLDSQAALKTQESLAGVLKLGELNLPGLEHYQRAVQSDLANNQYPGSPLLAKRLLREGDKAWLFEMHPQTLRELRNHCEEKRKCHVQAEDGFRGVLRLLPTASRRALVLIDPSYEIKEDYQTVVDIMAKAYEKMPQTVILLWYPVVERERINTLEAAIKKTNMRNVQLFELGVDDDDNPGMTASGMIAVNPPWTLTQSFQATLPNVAKRLSRDEKQRLRSEVLVPE